MSLVTTCILCTVENSHFCYKQEKNEHHQVVHVVIAVTKIYVDKFPLVTIFILN